MLFKKKFSPERYTHAHRDVDRFKGHAAVYQWDSVNSTRFDARVSVTVGNNLCKQTYEFNHIREFKVV